MSVPTAIASTCAPTALQPLEPYGREDLLEIMDDRAERHATIITAQLPIEHWHGWIGDATIADAILDRLCITPIA